MSAEVRLDRTLLEPGATVRGVVQLLPPPGEERRAVELSVLWETQGKGNTDQGVLLHEVLTDGPPETAVGHHPFSATLPLLPLTYHGNLLKVVWLVRIRRRGGLGNDQVFDTEFTVGEPS